MALFALLLLALWLYWPEHKTAEKNKQPNTISRGESLAEVRKSEPTEQPIYLHPSTTVEKSVVSEDIKPSKQFSYLQLYRDFRFNETCPISLKQVMAAENVLTVKQTQLEKFEQSGIQTNQPVTVFQLNQYETHLDQCIQLAKKYQDKITGWIKNMSSTENGSLHEFLALKLLSEPANTEKEKQLKALRKFIQPWDGAWRHLFNVSKGIISPEATAIKDQLDELEIKWRQQTQGVGFEFTEAERNTHHETTRALGAQLEQLLTMNPNKKTQAWNQVKQLVDEIMPYMLLQDFDVFFEASALLNDDRQMRFFNGSMVKHHFKKNNLNRLDIPYQKVAEKVMLLTGQTDKLNFLAIAPYANQLYLCTVGQPCDPGSAMMNHYCFSAEYPTACEKDLMAFFVEDFLSPNQLQDVINLYEQLVIIYAQ